MMLMMDNVLKFISIIVHQALVLFNYSAPAPNCLCSAGPTPWSVTLLLNRTSCNILMPLCKVMFPGSLHPLFHVKPPLYIAMTSEPIMQLQGMGFGLVIWDWDLGLQFGIGICDWDLDFNFGFGFGI